EIAQLAGCIVRAPEIETVYPEEFPVPPRRDIEGWAKLFDDTRPLRVAAADRLIAARKLMLIPQLAQRNACLRDPSFSGAIESRPENDTPRYARLRAQGELIRQLLP